MSSTRNARDCAGASVTDAMTLPEPGSAGEGPARDAAPRSVLDIDAALVTEILVRFVRDEVRKVGFERTRERA